MLFGSFPFSSFFCVEQNCSHDPADCGFTKLFDWFWNLGQLGYCHAKLVAHQVFVTVCVVIRKWVFVEDSHFIQKMLPHLSAPVLWYTRLANRQLAKGTKAAGEVVR